MKGPWSLSRRGLRGEGLALFSRSKALVSGLPLICFFLIMGRSSIPTSVSWAAANDLNPNMGRITRFTARCSCATIVFK